MDEPEQELEPDALVTKGREMEAGLIGAVLRRPALFDELKEVVSFYDFTWRPYALTWKAMVWLNEREMGIDILTVGDEIDRNDRLTDIFPHASENMVYTGRAALSFIRDQGQPQNARDYAANVKDYSAKRKILEVMSKGAKWALNGRRAHDILTDLEKSLAAVDPGASVSRNTVTLKEAVRAAVDRTDKAAHGEITYIESGFVKLDEIITGFTQPDLTIIAGRPGQGKTALLASIADNVIKHDKKVAFFSLEMDREQVAMRFISMMSGVSHGKQLSGKMSDEEWEDYYKAVGQLDNGDYGMMLNDLPAITPNRIRQEIRRLWPVDLVMVDYLQIAGSDQRYDARYLEVGAIAQALKNICKEFHIPLIAAAQLSREGDKRASGDKRPILSDLGESGKIEQVADKVIFIHRPTDSGTMADIIVAKQRNGPMGFFTLDYIGARTKFQNPKGLEYARKETV